jgi:hypothetical protein
MSLRPQAASAKVCWSGVASCALRQTRASTKTSSTTGFLGTGHRCRARRAAAASPSVCREIAAWDCATWSMRFMISSAVRIIRQGLIVAMALCFSSAASAGISAQPFAVSGAACSLGKAAPGGLHTLYWDMLGLTEVCAKAEVRTTSGAGAQLYVVAVFRGRGTETKPISILVRGHSRVTIGEASFRPPRFSLRTSTFQLDLISPDRRYQLVYPCDQSQDGCAYDGIVAPVSPDELLVLARAASLSGHVLGADFELTPTGLESIRSLARASNLDDIR